MPVGEQYGPVKPGEGVPVDKVSLVPVMDELRSGTYIIDDAQQAIHEALDNPATTKDEAKAALNTPPNKMFKIAFTGLVAEQIWPAYNERASAEDAGIYELTFEGSKARLARQPAESMADIPLCALADQIAASNQAMMSYAACEFFSGGRVPTISGDEEKDAEYFDAFRAQTDLQLTRTKHYFDVVPAHLDSPTRFVTSGMQSIRTHVFGIPNLVDGVSANEGLTLTPGQHRKAVGATYNKSIMPYFYPTGPLMLAIDSEFANPETQRLLPERWVSNGNLDRFFVFPRPEIVRSANQAAAKRGSYPVQASCPVVHSRVTNPENPEKTMPLTRGLGHVLLWQLDALYYPKAVQMAAKG